MDELMERVRGMTYFSNFDLKNGFNLIRIKEGDEWKTAFSTRYGQYEYLVMPFGLCNVPATFQRMMNEIFHDILDEGVVAFIDDILIYTNGTKQEHQAFVCKVLDCLLKYGLCIAIETCEFSVSELMYLGHILSGKGVLIDPDCIKAVLDWPIPKNKKEVQKFNGFANFYRRFVKSYAHINGPIAELLSAAIFSWGP
jgi:hypothetical protein